jgi:hypothetical protein
MDMKDKWPQCASRRGVSVTAGSVAAAGCAGSRAGVTAGGVAAEAAGGPDAGRLQ